MFAIMLAIIHYSSIAGQNIMQILTEPGFYTWSVQVGAYSALSEAEAVKETVESQTGIPTSVINGNKVYRVRVGHLAAGPLARLLANDLIEMGFGKGFVCKEKVTGDEVFSDFDQYVSERSFGSGLGGSEKVTTGVPDIQPQLLTVLDDVNRSSDVLPLYPASRLNLRKTVPMDATQINTLSNEKDKWLIRLSDADEDLWNQTTPSIPLKIHRFGSE